MKINVLFSIFAAALMAVSGAVVAGPDEKGKGGVVIEHSNGSDSGDGSVEIDVSTTAAIKHLIQHENDCVVSGSNDSIPADIYRDCLPDLPPIDTE